MKFLRSVGDEEHCGGEAAGVVVTGLDPPGIVPCMIVHIVPKMADAT